MNDPQPEKVEDILELEGLVLKKKKKKKQFNMDDLDKALNETGDVSAALSGDGTTGGVGDGGGGSALGASSAGLETNQIDDIGDDLNFDFAKKKKKKKKIITFDEDTEKHANDENVDAGAVSAGGENDGGITFGDGDGFANGGEGSGWLGSDRDYTYDELIEHVFNIIRANNPELNAGEKKRFVMKPPTVLRVGTKKTSFANFLEICKLVHRQPKHMQAFLLAELGTSGSVDANNQLIIKGRFQQKQIENVLRRYIKEYVACQTCRSPNTILQKETRLFFLQCEKCGSRRSVSSIKSGFQAVTSKRAAIRAKTN